RARPRPAGCAWTVRRARAAPKPSALGAHARGAARRHRRGLNARPHRAITSKPRRQSMSQHVADYILERLREWGIHRIYGYPGDGINALLGALDRAGSDPELIQVRHEEMAAFMACGHAKFTGEVGVCLATSGPGAIHLLNGLYDAKLDHAPVVAIVGQQPRHALGGHQQQEVDLLSLFKDVASSYVQVVMVPEQLPAVVDRAIRIARCERTVTCLILPADVQEAEAVETPPHEIKINPTSAAYSEPRVLPTDDDLRRAAEVLNSG